MQVTDVYSIISQALLINHVNYYTMEFNLLY